MNITLLIFTILYCLSLWEVMRNIICINAYATIFTLFTGLGNKSQQSPGQIVGLTKYCLRSSAIQLSQYFIYEKCDTMEIAGTELISVRDRLIHDASGLSIVWRSTLRQIILITVITLHTVLGWNTIERTICQLILYISEQQPLGFGFSRDFALHLSFLTSRTMSSNIYTELSIQPSSAISQSHLIYISVLLG